ncbi:hypothetical protein D0T49_05995 [Paludibacter sp. 221]|uniref:hypothetical protein n=1 Tax=Paludibacter sp. 221 TaxID=2302939 RepID=UPI0013D0D2CE|nr:hypothetical protein [Paludibacter sp. 221]NDV46594.1 hypothetical protein [Paludibacter sp. 221]
MLLISIPLGVMAQEPVKTATIPYSTRIELPPVLDESSGLMWWNGKLWSHNDSSGSDSIYAFDLETPQNYEQYHSGAPNKDWEALEQDEEYVYIGDFGNNKRILRQDLRIFKISKKSLLEGSPAVDTIKFYYPEQTDFSDRPQTEDTDFDCEAFIAAGDSLYLFTKQWISRQTAVYSLPKEAGTYAANYITTYNIDGLVTDADYLPNKRILALCGYSSTYLRQFIYILYDFEGTDFFSGQKYNFTLNLGLFPHQVEGITTPDGQRYYVTNEQTPVSTQRLHTFDVGNYFEEYLQRPETAGKISGATFACQDNIPVTYSVLPIPQAETYEWTLPQGAKGNSTSNSITVYFDTTAVSGNIIVRGVNSYGTGGGSSLPITVIRKPTTPYIHVAQWDRNILVASSPTGNQWYNHEGAIAGATSQYLKVDRYSRYYVVTSVEGCSSAPSNVIRTGAFMYLDVNNTKFETDTIIIPKKALPLHKHIEDNPKKKKRKFLFWYL